jgi:hypothetical protein
MMTYAKLHPGARGRRSPRRFSYPRSSRSVDVVICVRSHTGEVTSVYLMARDIEKLVEFLTRKGD